MRNILITFFIIYSSVVVEAQTIKIAVFNNKKISSYTVSIRTGEYILECDGEKYGEYNVNSIFLISMRGTKIEVRDKNNLIGSFSEVRILAKTKNCILTVKGILPSTDSHEYDDSFIFRINEKKLQAINYVNLEKYIAGVIEAEGGINAPFEYYKAQAVLIRTYTIKNIYKHAEEGFDLCDQVHCQAYHGRNVNNENIYKSTLATAGEVLIDQDSVLVMSPFHSNCGGQTSRAGIYWQSDLPYLQSVKDPFCLEQKNATWEKTINRYDWYKFLKSHGVSDPEKYMAYELSGRKKYFIENKLTMREIREKFGLKSSLFSIHTTGNQVVFNGRGYGHGIGMCQWGAIEMANVGYTYLDIIHFYFRNVSITDYREMELHRY